MVALVISAIFLYGGTCDTPICGGTGDELGAVSTTSSSSHAAAGSHSGAYIMVPQNASRVQGQPVMVFEEGSEDDSEEKKVKKPKRKKKGKKAGSASKRSEDAGDDDEEDEEGEDGEDDEAEGSESE